MGTSHKKGVTIQVNSISSIKIVFKLQLLSLYKANIFREQERPPHRRYDFQTMMQFNIKYGSQNNS